MAKKFTNSVKQLKPDATYQSKLVSKFVNCLMLKGKKSVANRVFYDAMDIISKRIKDKSAFEIFEGAIENVKPNLEVRSKRVGGSNYQVPRPVTRKRQQSLSIRWILDAVRKGKGKPTCEKLAKELMDAFKREGAAITVRENVHRMAEANKAFSHFAW